MSGKSNLKNTRPKLKKTSSKESKNYIATSNDNIVGKSFFDKNLNLFFYLSLFLCILFSILLFDVKVSIGEDDSGYIIQAKNFINGKDFPSWHGPFYPIFLALPMLVFDFNLIVFKLFSLLFIVGHFIFFFITLRKRINSALLFFTILLTSFNTSILYFSSQTYSEAMYMFLQSFMLFFMLKIIDFIDNNPQNRFYLKLYLPFGLLIFLLSITKNIGIVVLISVVLYFLLDKKVFAAMFSFLSYLLFKIPFELYKKTVWSTSTLNVQGQLGEILYKNPYNKTLGQEDFSGMVTRYFENLETYISKHFLNTIGLRNADKVDSSLFPAIIISILFLIGLVIAYRKNKTMFFISLYLLIAINVTFIALQQSWGQLRMIVIYIPLLIIFILWTLWEISQIKKLGIVKYILFIFVIFMFFKTFGQSVKKASINQKILSKNIEGNKYYGFTPDWVNFLKMSEWVGKNLPKDAVVASRKPSMSFIYAKGKEFYPIYRIPMEDGDSIIYRVKASGENICIFNLNELNSKGLPAINQIQARQSVDALIGQADKLYGICQTGETEGKALSGMLNSYGVSTFEPDTFLKELKKVSQAYYGVVPDTLLNRLKQNNVDYIIMASLRMNPNMKTANIVNTVQRYLLYIEVKYFNLFTLVHQFGGEDDEPTKLVKVNYEMYNQ